VIETIKPIKLPTIKHKGKKYYIDWRLQEFRPVDPPLRSIAFDSDLGREIDQMPDPAEDEELNVQYEG
jgi:hypothetical protein